MKTTIAKIISVVLGVLVAVVLIYFTVMYVKNQSTESSIFSVTADELINSFKGDERNANQQYLNKVIQVHGKLSNIGMLENNQVEITLMGNRYGSILCTLNPEKLFGMLDSIEMNAEILIEGNCIGFLNDVYLNNCTVFNSTKSKQRK